jgi:hypothetical protein
MQMLALVTNRDKTPGVDGSGCATTLPSSLSSPSHNTYAEGGTETRNSMQRPWFEKALNGTGTKAQFKKSAKV